MYDLIGDIHGHAAELVRLLQLLDYRRTETGFVHPERQIIFLGDYIDRGPEIRQTLQIVREMVESGSALAVLGNHELNAIAFHTPSPDRPGEHLRPRIPKNVRQHQQTLEQVPTAELADYLEWFRILPAWLDLPELRVVHACWNEEAMSLIDRAKAQHGGFTTAFLQRAFDHNDALFSAVETVFKGPEARLPEGVSFVDKDGQERRTMRTRWYLPAKNQTYRTYALQSDEIACDVPLAEEIIVQTHPYSENEKPVFVGHYWLWEQQPSALAANVACLDYSVAKGGFLTAYRWDGEGRIDDRKFVTSQATSISRP